MSRLRTLNRQAWGRVPGGAAGGGGEGLGYILAATRAGSRLSCPLLIIQMFLWPGLQELCRLVPSVRWRLQLHQLTTAANLFSLELVLGRKLMGLFLEGKPKSHLYPAADSVPATVSVSPDMCLNPHCDLQ